MSLTDMIILGVVVAMFAAFVAVLGGTNLYLVLSDRKAQERQERASRG
jgi:uncharacterized membrane protein YqiK